MCEPTTLIGIAAGATSAVGGMMQAQSQHRAAQAAADRQNQINELNYQNKLNIASHRDKLKGQAFKRKLEAHAQAKTALAAQHRLNELEKTRASITAQQVLKEKATALAFESQDNLVKKIQASGTILASGQQAGQSLLLTLMDEERKLGFQEAQVSANMRDAVTSYRIKEYGFDLDKYSADIAAVNKMPNKPVAPSASFQPVKMPKVEGPSGLGLMGGMLSAAGSGLSTGIGASSTTGEWFK